MPELNPINLAVVFGVVFLVVILVVVARLFRSARNCVCKSSLGNRRSGFAYALVPTTPQTMSGNSYSATEASGSQLLKNEQGSWQWCLAFIPAETHDTNSALPPWWAPPPPWNADSEQVSAEAEELSKLFSETNIVLPAINPKSKAG